MPVRTDSSLAARIAQRLGLALMTLLLVSMVVFAGTEAMPGDAAETVLDMDATPETLAALRAHMGLTEAAPRRYWRWLAGLLQGDAGNSLVSDRRIATDLLPRLRNTLFLAAVAGGAAFPLAIALGILSASRRNGPLDRALNLVTLGAGALPGFFVAYLLILAFAVERGWFPSLAAVTPGMPPGKRLAAVALPAATLALTVLAPVFRMSRAALIAVFAHPYMEMAALKGVPARRLVLAHALPNALGPVIQIVAFNLASMAVGVVVVETVFAYPGVGQYLVDAVGKRDVTAVQACGLIVGATYIGLNAAADIAATLLNPRLRSPR